MNSRQWVYRIALALLGLVVVLAPRGCTKQEVVLGADGEGNKALEFRVDAFLARPNPLKIGSATIKKNDYLLVVFYSFKGEAETPPSPGLSAPFYIVTSFPGKIVESNATRITEGKAYWALSWGEEYQLKLSSRLVRWWYLLPLVAGILILIYFALSRLKRETVAKKRKFV